jgi:hypothetical protein
MKEEKLVSLIERVLGPAKRARGGEEAVFKCPNCNHHKNKLTFNIYTQKFQCWVCDFKGGRALHLLRKAKAPTQILDQLKKIDQQYKFKPSKTQPKKDGPQLPTEFIPLINNSNSLLRKKAINYLEKRGITPKDIVKYNIGYAESGVCENMVIIPSYGDDGFLNYWVGRSFMENTFIKHRLSPSSKDIVGFDLFINWDMPIVICEGAFDAMTIKRNAIPMFGKKMGDQLKTKLITSNVPHIYLALDNDAIEDTLKYAKELRSYGKQVTILDLKEKDPNEVGFEGMLQHIRNSKPTTFSSFFEKLLFH